MNGTRPNDNMRINRNRTESYTPPLSNRQHLSRTSSHTRGSLSDLSRRGASSSASDSNAHFQIQDASTSTEEYLSEGDTAAEESPYEDSTAVEESLSEDFTSTDGSLSEDSTSTDGSLSENLSHLDNDPFLSNALQNLLQRTELENRLSAISSELSSIRHGGGANQHQLVAIRQEIRQIRATLANLDRMNIARPH
jgi:hypothetical protein